MWGEVIGDPESKDRKMTFLPLGPQVFPWLSLRVVKETETKKGGTLLALGLTLSKMSDAGGLSRGWT